MEKKDNKFISIIVIVGIIVVGIWVIIVYPYIKFKANEQVLKEASQRYFEINKNQLPSEGDIKTVTGIQLLDKKYVDTLKNAYGNEECDMKSSWVKVKKESGEYKYYTYLSCGLLKSRVDHVGPVITLKGNEEIEIERNEEFKDPGIKSVRDNTDGDMDVSKVQVKSDLDITKIGEYSIVYTITDSFENKSTVTRKVLVTQSLEKTVEHDTDDSGFYKGKIENNYIRFSGQLFRIVNVNSDKTVKIVSDEDISQVDYNSLDDWLNNYYYSHLTKEAREYIVKTNWCSDSVKNSKNDCISGKNKKNVGLLSINEYNSSLKEGESYLYTNTINWTSSSESDSKAWTVKDNFVNLDEKKLEYDKKYHFNVRPSVVLKKGVKIIDGNGTVDDPYDIGDFKTGKAGAKINTRYSGEYITYSNVLYRIIEVDNGYTKVILDGTIGDERVAFGTGSVYNPEQSGNIGYVIENTISKYVKVDLFTKHAVKVPIYTKDSSYTGKKTEKEYNIKFAAPNLYEMYSSGRSFWFINSSNNKNIEYLASDNGTVYFEFEDNSFKEYMQGYLRYTGYLKKDVTIVSGTGTYNDPYTINS